MEERNYSERKEDSVNEKARTRFEELGATRARLEEEAEAQMTTLTGTLAELLAIDEEQRGFSHRAGVRLTNDNHPPLAGTLRRWYAARLSVLLAPAGASIEHLEPLAEQDRLGGTGGR